MTARQLLNVVFVTAVSLGIVLGAAGRSDGQQDGLQELGFSVAPREGGKAHTSLFGVVGEGYKFVYVFDRSGSMGGRGEMRSEP